MDPLSEVLSMLKLRSYMAGGFDHAGEWSVAFGRHEGIKCYALVTGQCWLVVEDVPEPVHLEAGDCFLLPRGLPFRLASDLDLPAVDARVLHATPINGGIRTWNGGGEHLLVGGFFAFTGSHARMLLDELPPIVHIRSESDKEELRWCLERMRRELREQRPGGSLVAQQLATTLLVLALRLHLADGWNGRTGWLFALADKQVKAAITSMHDDPGHRWTLEKLAERSGMSRSIFALKFKATVGTSPMEYLTRWRMLLAAHRLTSSDEPISLIALSLGYKSETAFRSAFKKIMAYSPRQYRRGQNSVSLSHSEAEPAASASDGEKELAVFSGQQPH